MNLTYNFETDVRNVTMEKLAGLATPTGIILQGSHGSAALPFIFRDRISTDTFYDNSKTAMMIKRAAVKKILCTYKYMSKLAFEQRSYKLSPLEEDLIDQLLQLRSTNRMNEQELKRLEVDFKTKAAEQGMDPQLAFNKFNELVNLGSTINYTPSITTPDAYNNLSPRVNGRYRIRQGEEVGDFLSKNFDQFNPDKTTSNPYAHFYINNSRNWKGLTLNEQTQLFNDFINNTLGGQEAYDTLNALDKGKVDMFFKKMIDRDLGGFSMPQSNNQPVANQPVANQPVANQPVANQPVANQPVANQPVANQPVANQPVTNQPEKPQKRKQKSPQPAQPTQQPAQPTQQPAQPTQQPAQPTQQPATNKGTTPISSPWSQVGRDIGEFAKRHPLPTFAAGAASALGLAGAGYGLYRVGKKIFGDDDKPGFKVTYG